MSAYNIWAETIQLKQFNNAEQQRHDEQNNTQSKNPRINIDKKL